LGDVLEDGREDGFEPGMVVFLGECDRGVTQNEGGLLVVGQCVPGRLTGVKKKVGEEED
jgi:hypothetical protein